MDSFHQNPCPFCPRALKSESELYIHVLSHNESDKVSVRMQVEGRSLVLAKRSLASTMYACPEPSCDVESPIGLVWVHWMDDHSSSLGPSTSRLGQSTSCLGQSSAKRHLEAPSASSNKRARPSNFIPPSSQSSKPAATPVSCPPISPTTSRPTPSATPAPKTTQAPPVARKRANPFARPPPIPIDMNW
ncbi:hypothetical protein BT96DRAFT_1010915, partial [Gymnopus androsaceus JB14]